MGAGGSQVRRHRAGPRNLANICRGLEGYTGVVVVLTNPVDVMTVLVQEMLPKARVLGSGLSVDEARLKYCLWKLSLPVDASTRCPLAGEHGPRSVPVFNSWSWTESYIEKEKASVIEEGVEKARKFGYRVVKRLGYTLQDCAVEFTKDIIFLLKRSGGTRGFSYGVGGLPRARPLAWDPRMASKNALVGLATERG